MKYTLFALTITVSLIGRALFAVVAFPSDLRTEHLRAAHAVSQQAETPEPSQLGMTYTGLLEQVAPSSGKTIEVVWGNLGQRLLELGAIDPQRLGQLYGGFTPEQLDILQGDSLQQITFTPDNIRFWTNILWAFGLTQRSKVLREGPMQQHSAELPLDGYASTGGWTLGVLTATDLYNSAQIVELSPEQDDLVYRIAEHIYRPCCGNPTAFPDCNHGMALLGLLELLASQGASEEKLYDAALIFNSYAFPDTYVTLAAYFTQASIPWTEATPEAILSARFSSGQGAREIAAVVGTIPGSPYRRGNCGA